MVYSVNNNNKIKHLYDIDFSFVSFILALQNELN